MHRLPSVRARVPALSIAQSSYRFTAGGQAEEADREDSGVFFCELSVLGGMRQESQRLKSCVQRMGLIGRLTAEKL